MTGTVEVRPGPGLIGRVVPERPDHPITFAHDRAGLWWYGHQCGPACSRNSSHLSWATGVYYGTVTVLAAPADEPTA